MQHRRTTFAAAASLIALAGLVFLLLGEMAPTVAFADVVGKAGEAKTVQYTETRSDIPRPGEPRGPSHVTKVIILGKHRERREVVSATKGDPLPDGAVWSEATVGRVSISNLATGGIVSLDTNAKRFSRITGFLSINPDDGKVSRHAAQAHPEADFYARMREFPADKAEKLPARKLGEREVVGFRTIEKTERPRGVDTWTRTYWVDAQRQLPVEIEVTFESTDPRRGQSRWLQSDIVFDEPVDESLLSTEPPPGYTVHGD
jgi:hypothetical protein